MKHRSFVPVDCSLVLTGPPGSGKGTQAELLAEHFELNHIDTGAILRDEIASDTPLGRQVAPYVEAGKLVPSSILSAVIARRIQASPRAFLLDGFPRNLPQASALDQALHRLPHAIAKVVVLALDERTVVRRLQGRLACIANGHTYHRHLHPPHREGICDLDGSPLKMRQDDSDLDAVQSRMNLFSQETMPVIKRYEQIGLVSHLDANQSREELRQALRSVLLDTITTHEPGAHQSRGIAHDMPDTPARSDRHPSAA